MLVPILVVVGLAIFIPIIIEVSAAVGMNASLGKRGDGSVSIKYPLPSEQKDLIFKKDCFHFYSSISPRRYRGYSPRYSFNFFSMPLMRSLLISR